MDYSSTGAQRDVFASDGCDGYANGLRGRNSSSRSVLFFSHLVPLFEAGACMGRAPASFRAYGGAR
jgi:hypothetical protein